MYRKDAAPSLIEIPVTPFSPIFRLNEVIDPNGDPLDLLIRKEEGEEIATYLLTDERTKQRMNLLNNLQQLAFGNAFQAFHRFDFVNGTVSPVIFLAMSGGRISALVW